MDTDLEKQAKLLTELNDALDQAEKPGCGDFLLWFTVGHVLGVMMKGWVLSILWAWFMPQFGLPLVGAWHLMGVAGFIELMTASATVPAKSKETDMGTKTGLRTWALLSIVMPLMALFSGWIFHSLM